MAIKGLSKSETWQYASVNDDATDDGDKTWFKLGTLDANLRAYIGDNSFEQRVNAEGSFSLVDKGGTRAVNAVRFGLKGFTNFKLPNKPDGTPGDDVPWTTTMINIHGQAYETVGLETMNCIPPMLMAELASEIMTKNAVSEDMKKKLATQ